jgi:hypothetical protein
MARENIYVTLKKEMAIQNREVPQKTRKQITNMSSFQNAIVAKFCIWMG